MNNDENKDKKAQLRRSYGVTTPRAQASDKTESATDRNYQALYSYKLTFTFTTEAGSLENLNGKSFQVEAVDFATEYFPEASRRIFGK